MRTEGKKQFLLGKEWGDIKDIIVFGYGRQGIKAIETLVSDFNIIVILDNNPSKQGVNRLGIQIKKASDSLDLIKRYKIIVTVIERNYSEISEQLKEYGLIENKDYVMYQDFITEWYYKFRGKIYIPKTDIPITSLCSLDCEKCHVFIPYWKHRSHYDSEIIIQTVDNFFNVVDYVLDVDILGGEPLLHPEMSRIIEHIGKNYRDRIGYLGIITNGTIIPKPDTIRVLKKYSIRVSLSDYSKTIGEKSKANEICSVFDREQIEYLRNTNISWFDLGMPNDSYRYLGENVSKHFKLCNTVYHVIYENKFYCCGTAWSAQMSGLFPKSDYGFVDLTQSDIQGIKNNIMKCCRGMVKNGYLDFCQVCGGFGEDNTRIVETGAQINRVERK